MTSCWERTGFNCQVCPCCMLGMGTSGQAQLVSECAAPQRPPFAGSGLDAGPFLAAWIRAMPLAEQLAWVPGLVLKTTAEHTRGMPFESW
jgi:hypothetical protein